jgi:hypothetical protein
LQRMIALRIDRRLARRVDPSDVVQEAWPTLPCSSPTTCKNALCLSIPGCGNWPGSG